jgi:hypothetical protein
MPGDKAEQSSGRKFYRTSRNSSLFQCNILGKNRYTNCAKGFGTNLRGSIAGRNPIQRLVEAAKHADACFTVQIAMDFKHSGEAEL